MSEGRLIDYLDHIAQSAADACNFVEGFAKEEFLADKRTQQAVIMSLVIIGEAAGRLMDNFPSFAASHPTMPWRNMRGMRNRMAHGYFDVNLSLVWDTVKSALPELQRHVAAARADAELEDNG